MRKISAAYGKPFLQSGFGGRVNRASSIQAALVAYTKALKTNGGQGIF
jgi:arabinogalactan endo-1,4-beta-galactosidase